MIEYYLQIRNVHIAAALASVTLFAFRGLALFAGSAWARATPLRMLSYAIDTTLLTAALMLTTIIHQYPFTHAWLTAKVLLLIVYIGLGIMAFWSGLPRRRRLLAWIAALVVFGCIYSIARAHHPLGLLSRFN